MVLSLQTVLDMMQKLWFRSLYVGLSSLVKQIVDGGKMLSQLRVFVVSILLNLSQLCYLSEGHHGQQILMILVCI